MTREPRRFRPVLQTALVVLANLSALMIVSVSLAVQRDNDPNGNSGSPVTDGAVYTILVVLVLVLVTGALLCLSPNTRRTGAGAVLAVVAAVPIGLLVSVFALTSLLGD